MPPIYQQLFTLQQGLSIITVGPGHESTMLALSLPRHLYWSTLGSIISSVAIDFGVFLSNGLFSQGALACHVHPFRSAELMIGEI